MLICNHFMQIVVKANVRKRLKAQKTMYRLVPQGNPQGHQQMMPWKKVPQRQVTEKLQKWYLKSNRTLVLIMID